MAKSIESLVEKEIQKGSDSDRACAGRNRIQG